MKSLVANAERHIERVCTAAEIGRHTPKDLRDAYALQLLTAGSRSHTSRNGSTTRMFR